MKITSLFLLINLFIFLQASPPTLHDITQDPVKLYPSASITIDTIRPEHFNTLTVDTIKDQVGDINGDGINDIIVTRSRQFWVLYGAQGGFADSSETAQIDTKDGFQIKFSDTDSSYSLTDVGFIGDINGDKYSDLLVVLVSSVNGKPRKAYIIYGAEKSPPIFDASQATKVLFSDNQLNWDEYNNRLLSFGGLGDVNGDGVEDFFINSFQLQVFFGNKTLPSTDMDSILTGFSITGDSAGGGSTATVCFGYWAKISKAGDFNTDGFADIMLSTKCPNSQYAGDSKVYLVYGQKTFPETFQVEFLNNPGYPNGLIIEPQTEKDYFGSKIAPIADFNGDSIPDIMISSMYSSTSQLESALGGTYIFFGQKSFSGTIRQGFFDSKQEIGVFIPGVGHNIAGIGDLNKDGYADVLLTKDSFASVIYGASNLTKEFPIDSLNGDNGFNLTLIPQEFESVHTKTRIQNVLSLGDINGDSSPDFAFTYVDGKYRIITKDLPKATACIDAQYCLNSDANKYLDSMFCSSEAPLAPPGPHTDPEDSESTTTTSGMGSYNTATHGVYDKELEAVVRKDTMSPSTAALCGTAIGIGVSVAVFILGGYTSKWYQQNNYVQLDEQVQDWSEDSRKVQIYKIEEALKKKFKCYKCLLWGLLVIEVLSLLALVTEMEGIDGHFVVGLVLHSFKALAFGKAIEAYKKEALEKQKKTVFGMKVLLILAGVFLVVHTVSLYQEAKYYWNLPETGIEFALSVLLIAFFTIGSQMFVYLYAKKFMKLLEKREELRSHLQNSQADIQSRDYSSA